MAAHKKGQLHTGHYSDSSPAHTDSNDYDADAVRKSDKGVKDQLPTVYEASRRADRYVQPIADNDGLSAAIPKK